MIVLSVHNHYQQAGGEDESTALEVDLLRSRGHEVIEYREHNDRIRSLSPVRAGARAIWSRESYQAIRKLIEEREPDVVHVQNFFPLISPSVYYAAHEEGVPVVQTVRNFRIVCANGLLLRDGNPCEDCLGRAGPTPAIVHACYRDSRAATAAVVGMQVVHRALRTWARKVDLFIALTEFSRSKLIQAGLPADRIVVKPNYVEPSRGAPRTGTGSFFLFVGRLSPEKGVDTLIDAWTRLPGVRLKIVGDGPLEDEARRRVSEAGLAGTVELVGRVSAPEVAVLMRESTALIVPSRAYETFGRVAVEAFAAGVPVIASGRGSLGEVVEDGVTGLHFAPGDPADLAGRVRWLLENPAEGARMGARAYGTYRARFTADHNYEMLMDIYERVAGSPVAVPA